MLFARDARDAARALDPHHVRLERPLPAPRKDDRVALGLGDVRVVASEPRNRLPGRPTTSTHLAQWMGAA
jgi:hypothetical protein